MENLTDADKQILLLLARQALESGVRGKGLSDVNEKLLSPLLLAHGASFVTLTINAQLRGCIGSLQPFQALYEDVREHTVSAALEDYRFRPVHPSELKNINIEISRLTVPQSLIYKDTDDLLVRLRPGIDGVILRDGSRRATFLPQVWAQIPDKVKFLNHLCAKMGEDSQEWRQKHMDVQIYQVEEFHEHGSPDQIKPDSQT